MADKLSFGKGTIFEGGYGFIAQKVMRDTNISVYAKALYSYLCSFAGNSASAYPGTELIRKELRISKDTYYKALNELKKSNYITVEQEKTEAGKFKRNIYNIEFLPCPSTPDTENPVTGKPCPATPETAEKDTKSNLSFKSNNLKNKSLKEYGVASAESPPADSVDNSKYIKEVTDYITYYVNQYKKYRSKIHPTITSDYDYIEQRIIYAIAELGMEFHHWEAIVDQHFITQYKYNIDWHIRHFVSGKIMELRGYEVAY